MDAVVQLNSALQGRYDVDREIGAGGMATVYLARDVKHDRKVALKVLKPELGAVLGVERFLAEIKVTANLQHPNLLPLFDSGAADGLLFYVMPFVEGESLRGKLSREKQLPVDEAIRLATSIASALDYAHRHNVIHRDLKPENILLHDGQPVVADFGIALAVTNAGGGRITQTGLSLGTPSYMSPEQATGDRAIDNRTDIYSLGAMTYEMLTGEPPHIGNTSQAIIARVLTEKPRNIRISRPNVPVHVEAAVEHALEKLPADRFATAHEFSDALAGKLAITGSAMSPALTAQTRASSPTRVGRLRRALPWAATVVAAAAGMMAGASLFSPRDDARTTVRFPLNFDANTRPVDASGAPYALSPDGKLLVFVGQRGGVQKLFIRPLSEAGARELPGTEGGTQPFFSPDGNWIGFYASPQLKKVAVNGGTPVPLAEVPGFLGASWGTPEQMVISLNGQLALLAATGGAPRIIGKLDSSAAEIQQRWPLALRDGKHVLYTSWPSAGLSSGRIGVMTIATGKTRVLDLVGVHPLAVLEGYLVYASATSAIMAVPFDEGAQTISGTPAPVIDQVFVGGGGVLKGAVSRSGSLVYVAGSAQQQVILASRGAAPRVLIPGERQYSYPRYSPDGKRIAVTIAGTAGSDVWIYELSSGTTQKLSSEGKANERPDWTPDSKRVLYRSDRDKTSAIWWQPADLSGPAELLYKSAKVGVYEVEMSRDGKWLLMRVDGVAAVQDIWYRAVSGDTVAKPLVTGPAQDYTPRFSPDGKWVAYASNESGPFQIYVTPFPGPGAKHLVSTSGGMTPLWTRDGRKVVYINGAQILSATLSLQPNFSVIARDTLYDAPFATSGFVHANYDLAPDGKQLLLLKSASENDQVMVVHDWKYELRARMAAGKQ